MTGGKPPSPPPAARKKVEEDCRGEPELLRLLHEHAQRGYDREIEESESIWRTLPLFAGWSGFAGTSLKFLARAASQAERGAWAYATYALRGVIPIVFGLAVRHLWGVIAPRFHRYLPSDAVTSDYAEKLLQFYRDSGADVHGAEEATVRDVRRYIVNQLAGASAHNQALNQEKAYSRGQTLFYLFVGFIFSFAVSASILIDEKFVASSILKDAHVGKSKPAAQRSGKGPAPAPRPIPATPPRPTAPIH
jgi:hypothetical protein